MFFKENGQYRCAVYLRLSRSDGDQQESNSIKNQRALLNDYLGKHTELHKVDEYVDDGYSGTNFERPDFKRMMQDIENRKINCIIVKDLSRFGRNYIETGRYLERIFPFMGVRFIAINDHYDSAEENDDKGRILIPFNNLINDTYCRDISMRVRSHLDVKRKEGQFIGSFAGYGYQKDPKDKNHLIIDEYAAGIVQEIEVLQKTFYPVGIQFAVVEDDFCSTDRTADEVEQYFKEKAIEKIRFEFIANRQDSFEKGVLTHRQAKYGYDISEDRRSFVLDSESAYIVKLIFQMYLEGMTLQEIGAALDAQNVPSPQIQMTRNKKVTRKTKWPVTTIRSILVNPLYIGKLTLKLSGAEKKMEVPPIVSEEDFQKVQERINDSVKLPAPKRRSTPNILIKKIYDRASGERLLCRTTEDETRQIYSFDRKYKCFSGKAPYIESTEIFDAIRSSLKTAQEQARYIGRLLESDKDEVKRCQNIVLQPYREQARTLMDALSEKDVERTAVYRKYERCEMEQEQLEDFESRYQAEIEELEAEFKNIMMKVSVIEKAFSYVNPWLTKFQDLTTPEILERTHIKKYVEGVWIDDFKRVEVVLKEEEWTRFFPEEWMRTRKEN